MPKGDMTSAEFVKSGLQMRDSRRAVTDYKADLLRQLKDAGLPEPATEFRFNEKRGWRFDFAFKEEQVAVEYEGGIFSGQPSHSSPSGITRDIEKYTEANIAGWMVVRVTAQTVANGKALEYVRRALAKRKVRDCDCESGRKLAEVRRTVQGLANKLEG